MVLAEGSDVDLVRALAAAEPPPRATVWTGAVPAGHDLAWDVLMRAGRTDPAPSEEVPATAPAYVVDGRTVSVAAALTDDCAPWPLDAIATLVAGGTVLLAVP